MHDTMQKSKDVHHEIPVAVRIISLLSICGGKESINKQDRQSTYDVTLSRVRVTIVAVGRQ